MGASKAGNTLFILFVRFGLQSNTNWAEHKANTIN